MELESSENGFFFYPNALILWFGAFSREEKNAWYRQTKLICREYIAILQSFHILIDFVSDGRQ